MLPYLVSNSTLRKAGKARSIVEPPLHEFNYLLNYYLSQPLPDGGTLVTGACFLCYDRTLNVRVEPERRRHPRPPCIAPNRPIGLTPPAGHGSQVHIYSSQC